jgi:hypothetical protein
VGNGAARLYSVVLLSPIGRGPARAVSSPARAGRLRYRDEAVDDLAAACRKEVRPFHAQRIDDEQSPAAFRILGRVRENGRVGVGVEYLDEQTLNEMPHR